MTTEQLEQLMQAHKCGFCVFTCEDGGYGCEMLQDGDIMGFGHAPSIVEAVYEAMKSKMGHSEPYGAVIDGLERKAINDR